MAGGECRLTTATRSVTGTRSTKWEECVVTLLRGTLRTAWQWHESVNMPVFTVHPSLCNPAKTIDTSAQLPHDSKASTTDAASESVYCNICFVLKKYASVSSGMADKLISCLRLLLLSLRAVNGFYKLIQSAPPWLRSESNLDKLSEQLLHQIIFWCCAKTAVIMWLAHNGIFMLCTNKTKMTVLSWP